MDNKEQKLKALLIGVQLPKQTEQEINSSLAELARLVTTLGYDVVGQTHQRRKSERGAVVLGDGKLKQIAKWTGGTGEIGPLVVKKKHKAAERFAAEKAAAEADETPESDDEDAGLTFEERLAAEYADDADSEGDDTDASEVQEAEVRPDADPEVVIFDCDLSPSQLRNLESSLGVPVLDRTGVIIEIFSRHARTRAAKLQVEIARLTYVAPRMRETAGNEDRGGGGTGAKGAGETSLELDKRKIRDRIKELKTELAAVSKESDVRRTRRNQEITVALVGYTNAGKSSMMRALTGSEVLVADKLFATLDTTVRILYPETTPRILISDTVGFIKKLPHDLVASFKSTLDEALHASLLLFVVDSSDPSFRSQLEVTKSVLAEVGVGDTQSLLVLNKVDRLSEDERASLAAEYPDAYFLSAKSPQDIAQFRLKLISYFEEDMVDAEIMVPYSVQGAVGEIRAKMRVLAESYDDKGVKFQVRSHAENIDKIKKRFQL